MISAILWDVDGTLLDFIAAEKAAIRACFHEFGLGDVSDGEIERYSAINKRYWEKLERGEIAKNEVLVGRFREFFEWMGADPALAKAFNDSYQLRLGDTIAYCDDSLNLIRSLRGRVRQYVVSNGTVVAQTKKLAKSGLGAEMDGVFLSEEVGFEKPARAFFDRVFERIGEAREECLIVGDSLTSDIQGGNNAGIRACWYNPHGAENNTNARADFEIRSLNEVRRILDENQ